MKAAYFLACLALAGVLCGPMHATAIASPDSGTDSQKAGIEERRARELSQRGDAYAAKEEFPQAADEYISALKLAPTAFTSQERFHMAVVISWAGKYDAAIHVLRVLLDEHPEDRAARIHLAKVLSWSSNLNEAMAQADILLRDHPEDQEALLVKANALRWRGESADAIPFYKKALKQGDNFDVTIGLAYAYLNTGRKERAQELAGALRPQYSYQQKELKRFLDALCGVRASQGGVAFSYYRDSDQNRVNRYTLFAGRWFGNYESLLSYRFTEAKGLQQREHAEDLWVTTHTRIDALGVSVGAGLYGTSGVNLFTARAGIDESRDWWGVSANASREALTDTAELIQKRIVRTGGTIGLVEKASSRLSLSETYTRSGFSDGNESDDIQAGSRFTILRSPVATAAGYRFRYWNFRRQSGGGYFDPSHFSSHQVFISLSVEKDGFYAAFEPYAGYQAFLRNGNTTNAGFAGYSGSAGWRMRKCTSFELTAEGGNYAGGAAAGFSYYQVGARFLYYF